MPRLFLFLALLTSGCVGRGCSSAHEDADPGDSASVDEDATSPDGGR